MTRHAVAVAFALVSGVSPLHAQDLITFTVTRPSADVHKAPTQASAVIGHAPYRRSFEVLRNLGSWVRIPWPGGENGVGYLHVTWGTIANAATTVISAPDSAAGPPVAARSALATTAPAAVAVAKPAAPPQNPMASTAPTMVSLPSRVFGVGARMSAGPLAFSAAGRAWFRRSLGIQLEVGRSARIDAARVATLELAPSLVYSPRDAVTGSIWAKPYFGGGVTFSRWTHDLVVDTAGTSLNSDSRLGYQTFGGAEITWAALPSVSVSVDSRRQWVAALFDPSRTGRFAFTTSMHWYAK